MEGKSSRIARTQTIHQNERDRPPAFTRVCDMTYHLILGVLWASLGLIILLFDPPWIRNNLRQNTELSGWLALVLAAYNGVRWFGYRSVRAGRRAVPEPSRGRERTRKQSVETANSPNPDFIFDEKPRKGGDPPS
jgi:hypothetical protein